MPVPQPPKPAFPPLRPQERLTEAEERASRLQSRHVAERDVALVGCGWMMLDVGSEKRNGRVGGQAEDVDNMV